MRLPRSLSSHRPGRLAFAILTLSVALTGVVANYSLSHSTMRALDRILAFSDVTQVLVTAPTGNAVELSVGKADADHLHDVLIDTVANAVPPDIAVVPIRRFETRLVTDGPPRSAIAYAVGPSFFEASNATFDMGTATWHTGQDRCAIGSNAGAAYLRGAISTAELGGKPCKVNAVVTFDERPPFSSMNDAVFVQVDELSFDPRRPLAVSVLVSGPSDQLDLDLLKGRLGLTLDLSYLQIWSSQQRQSEAARLDRLVSIVSNGLGLVILLVGSASIASLMSFSVSERRREIAVRIAIGASKLQILLGVLLEALAICMIALVFGVIGGLFLADVLKEPLGEFIDLDDTGSGQPEYLAGLRAVFSFLGIALLAALGPAIQASRTDPSRTLRNT